MTFRWGVRSKSIENANANVNRIPYLVYKYIYIVKLKIKIMPYKKVFICNGSCAELSYFQNGNGELFIEMFDPTEDMAVCNWISLSKQDLRILIDDLQREFDGME